MVFGYQRALDGLRGVAILAVLLKHFQDVLPGGFLGVDVFFVLSGYLITQILLKDLETNNRIRFGNFYLRRTRRLLPALIGMLVLSGLVWNISSSSYSFIRSAISVLCYYANWASSYRTLREMGPNVHAWSLSIEEQFYLVWPILFLIFLKILPGRKAVARMVFIAIGLLMVTRALLYNAESPLGGYFSTLARADALLMGCGFAILPHSTQEEFWNGRKGKLVAWSCAFTLLAFCWGLKGISDFLLLGGFTVIAVYAAAVIMHVVSAPNGAMARALGSNWLVEVGKRSYGIYLYHLPIFMTFDHLIENGMNSDIANILKVALTVIVSWLSYKYLETPFLRKNQVPKQPSVFTTPASPAAA